MRIKILMYFTDKLEWKVKLIILSISMTSDYYVFCSFAYQVKISCVVSFV